MELNQRKELFSKAYVRAVAAVVGCSVDQPENDYDSVDLCIKAVDRDPVQPRRLELQLKWLICPAAICLQQRLYSPLCSALAKEIFHESNCTGFRSF